MTIESVREIKENSLEELHLQNRTKRWEQSIKIGEDHVAGDEAQ